MNVLVLGSGAREHALACRLKVGGGRRVFLAPGNGLAELDVETAPVKMNDPYDVLRVAKQLAVDFIVVGPEQPLLAGLADAVSVPVLGPIKAGAMLEGSKAFAKHLMQKAKVRTAAFFEANNADTAHHWLDKNPGPCVVKADGLMAGKGVIVCEDSQEAREAVSTLFAGGQHKVVIERRLRGKEVSLIALTDGEELRLFPLSRDYKRIHTGDKGKNTGGMGAFTPVRFTDEFDPHPMQTPATLAKQCIQPVLDALRAENIRYRGFIYAGIMFDEGKAHVLEYNARLGDPETQVLLAATDHDLLPAFWAASQGSLKDVPQWHTCGAAVNVVLAAKGYPDAPETGAHITGIEQARAMPHVHVFGAGVSRDRDRFFVNGGRVLSVVGHGPTVHEARMHAYAAADKIYFEGMQRREDIASERNDPIKRGHQGLPRAQRNQ